MIDILLIGMFTAFFLAIFEHLIDVLSIFLGNLVTNAVFAWGLSAIAYILLKDFDGRSFAIWSVAGAYAGSFLLSLATRVATYRPVMINPTRPE